MSDTTGTMEGLGGAKSAPEAKANAALVLLYAPNHAAIPAAFLLTGETVVIGREPPPGGFTILQNAVSRVHASVARTDEAWVVRDLESRNGVLVNGRRVRQHALASNDEVRIGDAIFKFVPTDADGYARFRIDGPGARIAEGVGGFAVSRLASEIATIAKAELSVLITGETGTGKELCARALHEASGRRGPLRALNCAAIPANLVESELFGFKRGAFTGADRDHAGMVRAAHGGTLLLDEIGDMPLDAQAKLLRMIETREIVPLGGAGSEKVDVRIVCATHRNLQALVDAGRFRGDLFARINGYALRLSPLRDHKEDLFLLVRHFLARAGRPDLGVTFPFMVSVCHYAWPYNARELDGAVRRAIAVAQGPELDAKDLPETLAACMVGYGAMPEEASGSPAPPPRAAPASAAAPGADTLRALLARHQGNVSAVARELGKDRVQIHRWLRLHGIAPDDYR